MTDNELLEQLFRPAKELRIDDDGFTERVMSRLPQRDAARLSNLWTAFCIVVAVVLFILLRGWEPIVKGVFTLMTTPLSLHSLLMLVATASVLGMLAIDEVIHRERLTAI